MFSSNKSRSIRTYYNLYVKRSTGIFLKRGRACIFYGLENVPWEEWVNSFLRQSKIAILTPILWRIVSDLNLNIVSCANIDFNSKFFWTGNQSCIFNLAIGFKLNREIYWFIVLFCQNFSVSLVKGLIVFYFIYPFQVCFDTRNNLISLEDIQKGLC